MYYMIEILGGEVEYSTMFQSYAYDVYLSLHSGDDDYLLISIF